jgi:hypothetical protein
MERMDEFFRATDNIDNGAANLIHLANAFMETGNQKVANDLLEIAGGIQEDVRAIRLAWSDSLGADLKTAQQHTATIMTALLLKR